MKRLSSLILLLISISSGAQNNDTSSFSFDNSPSVPYTTTDSAISASVEQGLHKKDTFKYFSIQDTNLSHYQLPSSFEKTKNWKKADISRSEIELYGHSYPDTFNLSSALAIIDTAQQFWSVCSAKSWCLSNYEDAFPHLITRLGIKKKVGLKNTADLIIWDRISTGELRFYGHRLSINEDLFTVAGRASWILNELTGEKFAVVYGNLTQQQSLDFKKLWKDYILILK